MTYSKNEVMEQLDKATKALREAASLMNSFENAANKAITDIAKSHLDPAAQEEAVNKKLEELNSSIQAKAELARGLVKKINIKQQSASENELGDRINLLMKAQEAMSKANTQLRGIKQKYTVPIILKTIEVMEKLDKAITAFEKFGQKDSIASIASINKVLQQAQEAIKEVKDAVADPTPKALERAEGPRSELDALSDALENARALYEKLDIESLKGNQKLANKIKHLEDAAVIIRDNYVKYSPVIKAYQKEFSHRIALKEEVEQIKQILDQLDDSTIIKKIVASGGKNALNKIRTAWKDAFKDLQEHLKAGKDPDTGKDKFLRTCDTAMARVSPELHKVGLFVYIQNLFKELYNKCISNPSKKSELKESNSIKATQAMKEGLEDVIHGKKSAVPDMKAKLQKLTKGNEETPSSENEDTGPTAQA